jgi:hypothetical protein
MPISPRPNPIERRYLLSIALVLAAACATSRPPASGGPKASLAPRLAPGQSTSSILGCLATGGQDKALTRGEGETEADRITIRATADGAVVTHGFAHPCCLDADVRTAIGNDVVTLHERLTGEPCRCMCQSTIETTMGLSARRWTIRVILERPDGSPQMAHEKSVEVPGRDNAP